MADQIVQNPAQLVMTIRSSEAHAALTAALEQLQSQPVDRNAVMTALDAIGTASGASGSDAPC